MKNLFKISGSASGRQRGRTSGNEHLVSQASIGTLIFFKVARAVLEEGVPILLPTPPPTTPPRGRSPPPAARR